MKKFDYTKIPEKLLTPEIVQMMGCIHEHKGKQELFVEANKDELISSISLNYKKQQNASEFVKVLKRFLCLYAIMVIVRVT